MSSLSTDSLSRLRAPLGLPDCLKQREFRSASHGDVSAEVVDRRYLIKECNRSMLEEINNE